MFLGPINQSKPWDSNGIDGCSRFLRKMWNLFFDKAGNFLPDNAEPTDDNLRSLHKLIKKVSDDMEVFSYNTSISAFMIAVGEFAAQRCTSRRILEQLVVLVAPFAPHIAEELWEKLGNEGSVCDAAWPESDEKYLRQDNVTLSVSFNGKTRFTLSFPVDATKEEIEKEALSCEQSKKYLDGKTVVKVIVVPGRIVNIVVR